MFNQNDDENYKPYLDNEFQEIVNEYDNQSINDENQLVKDKNIETIFDQVNTSKINIFINLSKVLKIYKTFIGRNNKFNKTNVHFITRWKHHDYPLYVLIRPRISLHELAGILSTHANKQYNLRQIRDLKNFYQTVCPKNNEK